MDKQDRNMEGRGEVLGFRVGRAWAQGFLVSIWPTRQAWVNLVEEAETIGGMQRQVNGELKTQPLRAKICGIWSKMTNQWLFGVQELL